MKRSDEQASFAIDIARLIFYAQARGYKLTLGEAYRPLVLQEMYLASGKSKTLDSMHLIRQAQDFNIFFDLDEDGTKEYMDTQEELKMIGSDLQEYWEGLSSKNRCGFAWGWDQGHFERRS